LVVDLDKTVLHTTTSLVAEAWRRSWGTELVELGPTGSAASPRMFTRLRPGLADFLEKAHRLFEMHVFTFGTRKYAEAVLKFIDPEKKYFATRILSRDESFSSKTKTQNLEVLFPSGYRLVSIIDDSVLVWNHSPNLLPAPPYEFFCDLEGEVNRNPGDANARAAKRTAGQLAAAALHIPPEYAADVTAKCGDRVGHALKDALFAELRCQLETDPEPPTESLDTEAMSLLGCRADTAAWFTAAHAAAEAAPDDKPPSFAESVDRAVEYIGLLFPPRGRTMTLDGDKVRVVCEVDEKTWKDGGELSEAQLAFLGAHVESVTSLSVEGPRRWVATLSPSVSDVVSRKDIDRAVWLVKERLFWNQPRAAAALLLVFRELLPCKYWFADDQALLDQYMAEINAGGGGKALVLRPPPPEDPDKGLTHMLDILSTLHKNFFEDHDGGQEPDVATVFRSIRTNYAEYPPWALAGTKIAFSGLIKRGSDPRKNELWVRAVQMGAFCVDAVEPDTTHLVTKAPASTERCKLASQVAGCRIVNVTWLRACFEQQRRVDETQYLLAKVLDTVSTAVDAREIIGLEVTDDRAAFDAMDEEVAALLAEGSSSEDDGDSAGKGDKHANDTDKDGDDFSTRPAKRLREEHLDSDDEATVYGAAGPGERSSSSDGSEDDMGEEFEAAAREMMSRFT